MPEPEPPEFDYENGDDTTEGLGDGGPLIVIVSGFLGSR